MNRGHIVNGLAVGDRAAITPVARWHVRCNACGTSATETERELRQGAVRCRNAACGKPNPEESLRQYRQRTEAEERARQRIADEKSALELATVEEKLNATHRELAKITRERVVNGQDSDCFNDTNGLSFSTAQIAQHNAREADEFLQQSGAYYHPSPENWATVKGYLDRNGLDKIYTVGVLDAAVKRLNEFHLLTPPPPPEQPVRQLQNHRPREEPEPVAAPRPAPGTLEGWDLLTGQPRTYSALEVNRMSGDEFRRASQLKTECRILAGEKSL